MKQMVTSMIWICKLNHLTLIPFLFVSYKYRVHKEKLSKLHTFTLGMRDGIIVYEHTSHPSNINTWKLLGNSMKTRVTSVEWTWLGLEWPPA